MQENSKNVTKGKDNVLVDIVNLAWHGLVIIISY